jgi:hypothetical protein
MPILDGNAHRGLGQDRSDVGRHVVGDLEVVFELGNAIRDESRVEEFEIPPDGRVGVLAHDQ